MQLKQLRAARAARVKKFLRFMPRRTNVHKYPVLKWFATSIRQRDFLWTFRTKAAIPALYAGCILTFMPLYGIQLALALALAFLLKANLPILVGLQLISNPLTILPIYYIAYQIGRFFVMIFGVEGPHLNMQELDLLLRSFRSGDWGANVEYLLMVFALTNLGGAIIGTFVGTVLSVMYKIGAYEVSVTYEKIRKFQQQRAVTHNKETTTTEFHAQQHPENNDRKDI